MKMIVFETVQCERTESRTDTQHSTRPMKKGRVGAKIILAS